ncbi:MAG: tetratricopeptide repeat protein [Chloroflexi bacterium]|nr:tetratricopeptide repeat protein [Chloroflexota bacterium]
MFNDADRLYQRALEKIDKQDFDGAREDLNEAIKLTPNDVGMRWTRMTFNHSHDLHQLALEDLDVLIDWYTNIDADMYEVIVNRYAESDPETDDTLESDQDFLFSKRAFSHEQLGYVDEMMADLNWLIDNGFGSSIRYMWRGGWKFKLGKLNGAIDDFTMAHQLSSDLATPLLRRAQAHYYREQYESALHDLDKIIASGAEGIDRWAALLWRGRVKYSQGNEAEALADFHTYSQISGHETFPDPQTYIEKYFIDTQKS